MCILEKLLVRRRYIVYSFCILLLGSILEQTKLAPTQAFIAKRKSVCKSARTPTWELFMDPVIRQHGGTLFFFGVKHHFRRTKNNVTHGHLLPALCRCGASSARADAAIPLSCQGVPAVALATASYRTTGQSTMRLQSLTLESR